MSKIRSFFFARLMMIGIVMIVASLVRGETVYKTNSGSDSILDLSRSSTGGTNAFTQIYAEGLIPTAADVIAFNELINFSSTFRVSRTDNAIFDLSGLLLGNVGGSVIISNGTVTNTASPPVTTGLTQTIRLGSSGIDMSAATANLTFGSEATVALGGTLTNASGSLTVATSAAQTWTLRNSRSLTFTNTPISLGHDVTIGFIGGNTAGTAGTVALNGNISGVGNMIISGMNGGSGGTVTMFGNNASWTGAVTVGGGSRLNLNYTGSTQNKLADTKTLTINRGQVDLQGTGGTLDPGALPPYDSDIVASVALGQGLNLISRSAGTAVLRANTITPGMGAGLNLGNIGTNAANSFITTDNLNSNNTLGSWAVAINAVTDINWVKNATNLADGKIIAAGGTDYTTQNNLNSWTTPTQNILVTGNPTASITSQTISSLKIARTVATSATTVDIGAGNTLTINDGLNGGGIIRNQNGATTVGGSTVGANFLSAGGTGDAAPDTLRLWNVQNIMTINSVIADNAAGAGNELHLFTGGAGTVRLNAANAYTGGTTIAAGILILGSGAADVNGDSADTGTGGIANFGILQIDKSTGSTSLISNNISGTGSLTLPTRAALTAFGVTLSGLNTYTGDTNIGAFTTLSAGSATGLSTDSAVVLNGASGVLDLATNNSSIASLRGNQATASVLLNSGEILTLSGSEKARPGSPDQTLASFAQVYQGIISGAGSIIKNGDFTQSFTGLGVVSYSGNTTINAGTLLTTKALSTSGLTLNGSGAFVSNIAGVVGNTVPVDLNGSSSLWTIGDTFNQSVGSLKGVTGGRVATGTGMTLTVGNTTGAAVTFGGVVTGGANLVFDGSNPWVLTGGNSYTGTTTLNQNVLRIGASNLVEVLPDRTALTLANSVGVGLDLNGNRETIGSLSGGGLVGGNVILAATGRLTTGGNNASTTFAGVISGGTAGVDALVKVGNGTMTLTNANTFVGNVLIRGTGGGLTLSGGSALADTVGVRNAGLGTTLTLTNSETLGAVTGARNTVLALGTNTLTASYANGAAVATPSTVDSDAGIRVLKDISTAGLAPGMLISGAGGLAGAYIVQILDGNNILINDLPIANTNVATTTTSTSVLSSTITGTGGFTKNGDGLLHLTAKNTYSGPTTLNLGTVQLGGIWDGSKFAIQDMLSDSSQIVFAGAGGQNLNFASSATNLLSFERVGSIGGGAGATTTVNLLAGANAGALAIGADGSTSTFTGGIQGNTNFSSVFSTNSTTTVDTGNTMGLVVGMSVTGAGIPANATISAITSATSFTLSAAATTTVGGNNLAFNYNATPWLIKEGVGTFTWSNPTTDIFDGTVLLDRGGFTTGGAQGLGAASTLFLQNNTTTFTAAVTDTFSILQGGGKGASRLFPNGTVGALTANYVGGTDAALAISTGVVLTSNTGTNSIYGGVISGFGGFTKAGASALDLRGANSFTGLTTVTTGVLRMGAYGAAAGLGAPGAGGFGTLAAGTSLVITGGTLDINSSTQTVAGIAAGSSGGTIQLVNGSLTLAAQTTQSSATVITGNLGSVVNIASPAAATLTLTGNSNAFAGTINMGTNAAVTSNLSGGALGDTARINLNGTGTQLTVTLADTIGSLSGTGNATLTQALTLSEARSGTVSATGYSGIMSSAGPLNLGLTATTGMGGLTLSKAQTYTGGTVVNSRSLLNLNYNLSSATDILPNTGALTLNSGRIRLYNTTAVPAIVDAVASTTLNAGASSIESFAAFNAEAPMTQTLGKGALNLGVITRAAGNGGTLLVGANSAAQSLTGQLPSWVVFNGTDWAVGNNTTAAITALAPGSYTANSFGAGVNTDVTANSAGSATNTIRFNTLGAFTVTNASAAAITTGGILVTPNVGANTSTITGAGALSSGASAELILQQFNPLGDLVLDNVGGTNTIITKAGGGRAIITNSIAGNGTTFVNAGILQLGSGVGGGATGMVGTGAIRMDGILAVNRSNTLSIGAAISGYGNLVQMGSGRTILSVANTYTGRTLVNSGILEITNVAGLGSGTATQNIGANLTSIRSGATLDINSAGIITEALSLSGGTVNLRGVSATTLTSGIVAGSTVPITFTEGSTFSLGAGAAVTHVISAPLIGAPGANLIVNGVASGSTVALTSGGNQFSGSLTIGANANLSVGNNTAGTLGGRGNVVNNGTLIFNSNDAHLVVGNAFSGTGNLVVLRNNVYLTGSNTSAGATVGSTTAGVVADGATLNIGNDTYTGFQGTGTLTLQAPTDASVLVRTHRNDDLSINSLVLNPNNSGTARNTTFVRQGLGSVNIGNISVGLTNAGGGTQRAILQADPGGNLTISGTLTAGTTRLMNIVNSNVNTSSVLAGAVIFGGSASNTYDGILSGNNIWAFNNTGTTTLTGANTVDSAHTYIYRGTVALNGGSAMNNDNDFHILRGATLQVNATETLGNMFLQTGAVMNLAAATTTTVDDPAAHFVNGSINGGAGSVLNLTGGNFFALFNNSSSVPTINLQNGTIAVRDLENGGVNSSLGSGASLQLGSTTTAGNLEFYGMNSLTNDTNRTLSLTGTTGGARITANGSVPLILNGNIVNSTAGNKTLQLTGQTNVGGTTASASALSNTINGSITEGANVITLSMPGTANDDRFGFGRWRLTNSASDFSGAVTITVGTLDLNGDLKTGVETTSVLGDLSATRTISLGTNGFDGRIYTNQGGGDSLGVAGGNGSMGTIIFNDPNIGTAILGTNITFNSASNNDQNAGRAQIVNDGIKVITIAGNLTSAAAGARPWVLDGTNTGINTISGIISDTANAGDNVSIIKEGIGTWRLSGANTFDGGVTITRGLLQVTGGDAINDAAAVAVNDAGADGLATINHATFQVIGSETIGELTGNIGATTLIDAGQTLTMAGDNATYSGIISGAGRLSKFVTGTTGATFTAPNKSTYTGVTTIGNAGGAAAGISVTHLSNGGLSSGIGAGSSAAANLVFNNGANTGGGLIWTGFTDQSTDRLFTMGTGVGAASIIANGQLVGTTAPRVSFSNSGAIAFRASNQTGTIQLGGGTISDNQFNPQITNNGTAAITLSKTGAGLWVVSNGANSFTGGTTVNAGTLAITAGGALGTGDVSLRGGAGTGLQIRGGAGGVTIANNFDYSPLSGAPSDGSINATGGGSNTASGTLSFNVTNDTSPNTSGFRISVDSGTTLDFTNTTASLTGAGIGTSNITKFGGGTLALSGFNNYSAGGMIVSGGTLRLNYAASDTSKLLDTAFLNLGWSGSGVITGLGADDNVAGQTNVTGMSGARLDLAGGTHTEIVSATTLGIGSNSVTRSSGSAILRMNTITRNTGATVDFGAASIATADNSISNGILGGYATVGKSGWAVTVASNPGDTSITALAASGYNNGLAVTTYGTNFNTDVIAFTGPTDGEITNTLRFNQAVGGTLTLGGELNLQTGGILMTSSSGNVIITGGKIQNNGTAGGLEAAVIHQHSANSLQINSVIQNNTGAQGLTKSGTGKVFLNGVNTQTGTINLNEGEIQVGGTIASPTTPTIASLGGGNGLNISQDAILTFNSIDSSIYNFGTLQGGGNIQTTTGHTQTLLLDADSGNYTGNITIGGSSLLRVSGNNNALGNIRGLTTLNTGATLQLDDSRSLAEFITMNQGTTLRLLSAAAGATISGKLTLNNTSTAGVVMDLASGSALTLSGIIQTSNGFTKNGNGTLTLNANQFTDALDGFNGANAAPALVGQIRFNGGLLNLGNARALGATGIGNETIIGIGATIDLRGQALNFGDDSNPTREIISIAGVGINGLGALRNTTGTGTISGLALTGNARISGGGFANGSILNFSTFDTQTNNGSALPGNFIRNQPTIDGGGFDLTISGNRNGADNVILQDPSFTTALNKIIVREGGLRIDKAIGPSSPFTGITSANITNGIEIGYGGLTAADLTNPALGLGPNVGARLNFLNNWDIHHTVGITMNGVLAAANGGVNYIDTSATTIPSSRTYLDGTISLSGNAARNVFNIDSQTTNNTVAEQGNLTGPLLSKVIVGGQITGLGGLTKTGAREMRLTNDNTFSGDVNVLRFGFTSVPWQSNTVTVNGVDYPTFGDGEGWAEWGLTLGGLNGTLSGTGNIVLQRRGMITLDNTTRLDLSSATPGGNNNNRINDAANILFNDGWLRINGGTVNNTESLASASGAKVQIQTGTNILDLYPTDGAGTNMTLTIGEISRTSGAVLRIQNLDSTSTFSTAGGANSVRVALGSIGTLSDVGAATGGTDKKIVVGILGGTIPHTLGEDLRLLAFNNGNASDSLNQARALQQLSGSHFMTYDGGFLRPLDDSEYFVPSDGLINTATGAAGQNVNVNDVFTIMNGNTAVNSLRFGPLADNDGSGGAINSGTTLTSYTLGHAVQLLVDGTLTIDSGMISSAYFTVGNSASITTRILGGSLNFGSRDAVINSQNGIVRLTDGTIATGNLEIYSNILGTGGLTKTGLSQLTLDGANSYSGLTTISDGAVVVRSGRAGLGVGGTGNGIVISGNGALSSGGGVQIGTAAAPEDLLIRVLLGNQQVMRVTDDLTNWYGDVIIDNVDVSGQVLVTPLIRIDAGATSRINGDIFGGPTPVVNDIGAIDSRLVQFDAAGNGVFHFGGQFGDRGIAGAAAPIANPISTLPTGTVLPAGFALPVGTVVTNENEVLRVNFNGNVETNFILDRQWNAAGRLTNISGVMLINYDPAAPGNDGTGFWTDTAISKIPFGDSNTTAYTTNGSTSQQGFVLGSGANGVSALFLQRPGQAFNMNSWTTAGTGSKTVGGLNETGTVTFGNGTGTLNITGVEVQLYAASGGTVLFNQRLTGSPGTAPENLGVLKIGRGTVILQNDSQVTASDTNLELGGGTLILDHEGGANIARVGNGVVTFNGGVLIAKPHQSNPSTVNVATSNGADVLARFFVGGSELIAQTENSRNMTINIGNTNANGGPSTPNLTRALGATTNLVEWQSTPALPGLSQITLQFNSATTVLSKNAVIPWATYGTAPRTAVDFAMVDAASSPVVNDVRAFGRAADEYVNNLAAWTAGMDVSENGGAGFNGTIGSSVSVNTVRFDTPADSMISIAGGQALSLIGNRLAGGILVSSNVGGANKTIDGGILSAAAFSLTGDINFVANYTGDFLISSTLVTNVSSTAGLEIGMPVTGPGIEANTTIAAINVGAGTITLSKKPIGAGTTAALTSDPANTIIYHASSVADLAVGMGITGPTIPVGATITAITPGITGSTITISAAATTTTAGAAISSATPEIVFHQYSTGKLIVNSVIANDPTGSSTIPVAVTVTGPSSTGVADIGTTGAVVFNGINTYTGRTIIGGSVLEFSNTLNLGVNPAAAVTNQITLNGGTLRFTTPGYADLGNRGVRIEGNGGVFDVVDPNGEVRISADLNSIRTFQGDLVKVGAGTLTLGAINNPNFGGLIDVREGTLRLNSVGTTAAAATTILGSNASIASGTIFRTGANFAIQMGNGNNTGDWTTEEWLTFEGENYITVGTPNRDLATPAGFDNPSARAGVNLNGVNTLSGNVTIDTVNTQIVRLNNGTGYTTGNGDIIKDGQGTLQFRGNAPNWTGGLNIKQGSVYAANQADMLGTGYLTGKIITLGSNERQGVASLLIQNPDNLQNHAFEVNNNINVVYNPTQTKRIGIDNISNGDTVAFNGDITLNDNVILLMRDLTISAGGEQAYVNFNGKFNDGAITSGNIVVQTDDTDATANNLTAGRTYGYALFNGDNSAWTGDLTISTNLTYNQDNTAIVRLNNASALTSANDVTMNFNSILQVGGGARAIGSLVTLGGNGPFFGDAGTMSASTNGSSEIIENAASTIGTLTINQSTPVAVEVVWDAKFRNGTLNSQFFAPGTNTFQPSAALNIVKQGAGWSVLTLDNDYTGTTTVAAGILQVGRASVGDSGATNAAGLTVNSGATLAGTGIVQGASVVESGANFAPGDLAGALMGTLTFNGSVALQTGSITTLQTQRATYNNGGYVGGNDYATWINGVPTDVYSNALLDPVLSSQHDSVNVLGSLTWANGTKIVLSNNGYTPTVGDVFDLFDWFSVIGSVNVGNRFRSGTELGTDLDLFELGGNYRWDTGLFNSHGILVVVVPGIIPEPSRLLLLLIGVGSLLVRRRRP